MTAATFDHQVRKSLEFFEQQRNEKTARARFIGALYFEARAESRMRLEADSDTDLETTFSASRLLRLQR
jgi:hypothetical protein